MKSKTDTTKIKYIEVDIIEVKAIFLNFVASFRSGGKK